MPLYVEVLGFLTENVTTTDTRAVLTSLFADVDDHTDDTLVRAVRDALVEYPAVVVWCLTVLQGSPKSSALLHRITAADHAVTANEEIARRILARESEFPAVLEKKKTNWGFTKSGDAFTKAFKKAERAIADSKWSEDAKALRKELAEPILEALQVLPVEDARRRDLWYLASWLKSSKVRALAMTAIENADPALTDEDIDRQRALVFEDLPKRVAEELTRGASPPWIPRVVKILDQYDLAKPEWPR